MPGGPREPRVLFRIDLGYNDLEEGGGRALAEALRLNSTVTWLHLSTNDLGVEQESALLLSWGDRGGSLKLTMRSDSSSAHSVTLREFQESAIDEFLAAFPDNPDEMLEAFPDSPATEYGVSFYDSDSGDAASDSSD